MANDTYNPVKNAAHCAVRYALRMGYLIRPDICSVCWGKGKLPSDGRSSIEAHHHNGYENKLDVIWLCIQCHAATERNHHGSRNSRARLTEESVIEIKKLLQRKELSHSTIGTRFGVSKLVIDAISTGRNWGWLKLSQQENLNA